MAESVFWAAILLISSFIFGLILVFCFALACRSLFYFKNNIDPIHTFSKSDIQHTLLDVLKDGDEQRRVESGWQ